SISIISNKYVNLELTASISEWWLLLQNTVECLIFESQYHYLHKFTIYFLCLVLSIHYVHFIMHFLLVHQIKASLIAAKPEEKAEEEPEFPLENLPFQDKMITFTQNTPTKVTTHLVYTRMHGVSWASFLSFTKTSLPSLWFENTPNFIV
ncbi:hypothetical protein ACJX0J_031402, partial [Zea mays]